MRWMRRYARSLRSRQRTQNSMVKFLRVSVFANDRGYHRYLLFQWSKVKRGIYLVWALRDGATGKIHKCVGGRKAIIVLRDSYEEGTSTH